MAFSITVHHGPEFLVVEGAGPALLGDMCGFMDLVAETAAKHGHRRVLMNLLAVEIDFGFTDHMALGAHAASELAGMERVASVVAAKYRVGTSERAAQKMGLALKTFTSLDEGLTWLREEG